MARIPNLIISIFVLISYQAIANSLISGQLLNESGQPISQAAVKLNQQTVTTDKQGSYQFNAEESDIYQLSYQKDGYYSIIQTFSHFELANQQKPFNIADITLVNKQANRALFVFTGDTMMGRRYYKPYFGDDTLINNDNRLADSKAIVQYVKPYLELADIATTNLETQVFEEIPGKAAPKSVSFFSKPEILDALTWAGIDYVTLGNNHTYDFKESGLEETLKHLNNSTLGFSGAGINQDKALNAYHKKVNGTDYAMLGYVGWEGSAKPNQVAEHNKGGAAYGTETNITDSVNQQVQQNYVPIVQYHGSQEYANNPTGVTEHRLKTALDHGAALAIAHHPHVTQGLELYNNKLIAYSMGNFVFDQYIPSTPYTFLLYVWLDQGKFHRAEIVPFYLKGYKPTPATGINRYTVMKRLQALSAQRNTTINYSGGHGVITNKTNKVNKQKATVSLPNDTQVAPLYLLPWHKQVAQVNLPKGVKYRLGTNLINGSDFESFETFNSKERSWFYDRNITHLNNYGASGNKSLGINLAKNQPSSFGMQAFRRVYKASSPNTIIAKVKTKHAIKISFYWQGRKTRDKFFQARKQGKKHLIKSINLTGQKSWQPLEINFNSPRIGYRSYRVFAQVELLNGEKSQVDIDDFALIEWQTAFTNKKQPRLFNIDGQQASFIGLNKPIKQAIELTLE